MFYCESVCTVFCSLNLRLDGGLFYFFKKDKAMLHLFMKTNDLLLVGVYCSLLDNTKMQYTAKAIYFVCCVI